MGGACFLEFGGAGRFGWGYPAVEGPAAVEEGEDAGAGGGFDGPCDPEC